jgi:dihydroorotase/N-acyl-D-amino-acid deacylase
MKTRLLVVLAAVSACRPVTAPRPSDGGYDVVISGGRIVDGSGNAWFYGDVGIRGDRIATITGPGMLASAAARDRVQLSKEMVVAPGFIDIQGHSLSLLLLGDNRIPGKLTQGVTTEILGEGATPAPITLQAAESLSARNPANAVLWRSFAEPRGFDNYLRAIQARGPSINVGSFVGAGTIREYGMEQRMGAATGAALDAMRSAVARAMQDGAFGMASALIYPPNNFASTEELIAEARAMAPYRGVYITHMRSEADRLLEAIDEAIRIGVDGGVPVEIFHLKAAGRRNWPKMAQAVAKIDSARRAGVDVQANMYPYAAGGTGLSACLPPWASADGKLFDNLRDAAMRKRIREDVERDTGEWENLCLLATPEGVLIARLTKPENQRWTGKRLSEIAAGTGKDYLDTAMDLILSENSRVETIYFLMSDENVRSQLKLPWMKFGTDAGGPHPDSVRGMLHPRSYGTYPRILGRYVRDEGVLSLEDAVRKMSSAVATRLMIADRGQLRAGNYADVVVFDPRTIMDNATFEQPLQLSTGVTHVWVNGVRVVRDGAHTGAKPGRVVRGPGYRP